MRGQRIAVRLLLVAAALATFARPVRAQGIARTGGDNQAVAVKDAGKETDASQSPIVACHDQAGYLVVPVKDCKGGYHCAIQPYDPQPGDILLYNYSCSLYSVLFWLVGTDTPTHAAIVIERPGGGAAILEVG